MNKQQKEVLTHQLNDEQKQLKWLNQVYTQAQKDTAQKIAELSSRTDMENLQSIIYQKKYQEALQKQIQSTLDKLQGASFDGISDYLNKCYETGYVGAMYDIFNQGIPIISPIDQKQVKKAIETDSKISKGLYNRLGEDVDKLKMSIKAELSRGIVEGKTWNEMADRLARGMNSPFNRAKNNAMRIARTEGHRIQIQSQMDAQQEAKSNGADVLKQWDATLDDRTRDSHRELDGQIRELDEDFEIDGMTASAPSMFGDPAEDCNCRCALLQRARWGLDEDELETLEDRAEYFDLDKTEDFEDFKEKYLGITNEDIEEYDENAIMKMNLQLFAKNSDYYETIILPKDEYAQVMSELNTHMTDEQRNQKIVKKAIGNNIYTVENNGFGDYRIIGRKPIDEDVLDWWDE